MAWQPHKSHDPPYSVFTGNIEQEDADSRQLRLIRLHNGMQILVVQDPVTPMSAASLTVRVGDVRDPEDVPGLAHFLEHILTHGSDRYPEPHSFQTVRADAIRELGHEINQHSLDAIYNARYDITVENNALDGALDRFASFLCRPLFPDRAMHQEVCCIESEFRNYLVDDSWRLYHLNRHLSRAGDSWRNFGVGNWDTLTHKAASDSKEWISDLRARLCKWFSENYCASRMYMAIIGADSLDKLTAMAISHFSSVPQGLPTRLSVPPKFDSPWSADEEGTVILVKTMQDVHEIEVRWIVPTQTLLYRVKPLEFLSFFLHRRGSGSLHEVLASRGWITSLHASQFAGDRDRGFQSFYVVIYVTHAGWRAWEAVVATLHKYIILVQDMIVSDSEFGNNVQRELCALSQLNFRYRAPLDPLDEAVLLGSTLSRSYPPGDVITGRFITQDWDAPLVSKILTFLTPDKARVTLRAREDWQGLALHGKPILDDTVTWDQAPWYNTEYKVFRLVTANKAAYTPNDAVLEGLHLRYARSYVPESLDVLGGKMDGAEPNAEPRKIHDTPLSELWYKLDDRFGVPKTCVIIHIITIIAEYSKSLENILHRILDKLINDALADDFYDAAVCLLKCKIGLGSDGITLEIYGFSETVPTILESIFDKLAKLVINPVALRIAREEVRKELENESLASPGYAANEWLDYLLSEYGWTTSEILLELYAVNSSSMQQHLADFLGRVHLCILVNGNVKEEGAVNILKIVEDALESTPISKAERMAIYRRDLILPEGCNFIYKVSVPNAENANSGLAFHLQIGDDTSASLRAMLTVLSRTIGTPIHNQLQVTEQLGYHVHVMQCPYGRILGMRISIQGPHDPAYLEQRVEVCLEQMRLHIDQLAEDDFENVKALSMKSLRREPTDIEKEAHRFWDRIVSGYYDFMRREAEAKAVECLTKTDLLGFFHKYICPGSPTRRKLSVWYKSTQSCKPTNKPTGTSGIFIEDPSTFKSALYPNILPTSIRKE